MAGNFSDLRVLSGTLKGQKITFPEVKGTHPMGARERLALFNMVDVRDKVVADVYAGSGALGIEALSRGAKKVVFVEKNRKICQNLQANLQRICPGYIENTQISPQNALNFAKESSNLGLFEVALVDPPYDSWSLETVQEVAKILQKGGVLALSSPAKASIPELGLEVVSSHTYAGARITVYQG